MAMDDRHDVTVPMPGALLDEIDGELTYGDSRSEWIRDAIRQKLQEEAVHAEGDVEQSA